MLGTYLIEFETPAELALFFVSPIALLVVSKVWGVSPFSPCGQREREREREREKLHE